MNPLAQVGMNTPGWIVPLYQRYLRLQEWSCANDYRLPTRADMQYLRLLSGFDNARIVYFLSDHTLAYIATQTAREVDASNRAPRNFTGEDRLLPGLIGPSQTEHVTPRDDGSRTCSLPTNVVAGASSMFGILDGNHYYSIGNGALDESAESQTMSDPENGYHHNYQDEPSSSVQQSSAQSLHPNSANDNGLSGSQMAESSSTISETVPESVQLVNSAGARVSALQASGTTPSSISPQEPPSNLRLQSPESDSERIGVAQILLDIHSNPRPSLPSPQPLLERGSLSEQPMLPSAASSPQPTLPQEGPLDREENPTPVSEEAYAHLTNVRVAMMNSGAGNFTVTHRNFLLDSFARSYKDFTIGLAISDDDGKCRTEKSIAHVEVTSGPDCISDKEQPPLKVQKEVSVGREDSVVNNQFLELENTTTEEESPTIQPVMTDPVSSGGQNKLEEGNLEMRGFSTGDTNGQVVVVEDDMITIEGIESDSSTTREEHPLIRPILSKPTAIISQKQVNLKDSEDYISSEEDSVEPGTSSQDGRAIVRGVEDETPSAVAMTTGDSEMLTGIPLRAHYLYAFLSSLEADGELLAGPQDDAVSAIIDGVESDTSSREAESVEQHLSHGHSAHAEERDQPPTSPQSPAGVQISDLTSQLPDLARQVSDESSALESVTMMDDGSDQMALHSRGPAVENAVDVAARTAVTVGAWCEALNERVDGEDEEGIVGNRDCGL